MENIFCCPKSKNKLERKPLGYYCNYCRLIFPEVAGIPDFRVTEKPTDAEKKLVGMLLNNYQQVDYGQLIRLSSEFINRSTRSTKILDLTERQILLSLNFKPVGINKLFEINYSLRARAKSISNRLHLEIGCGEGGALLGLSSNYQKSIGLDINLPSLIIAKKKIEQENIRNIILACGEAEYLPFNNSVFDLVNMSNTIEHVASIKKTLIESRRVINNNGTVFFNSPNRFCLNRMEPHVRIWGVGFMPRKWMHLYVKIMSGNTIHYYRPSYYHNLSLFELKRTLTEVFGRSYKIINYILDESSPPRTIIGRIYRKYQTINKLFNSFPLNVFIPDQHFVITWKQ